MSEHNRSLGRRSFLSNAASSAAAIAASVPAALAAAQATASKEPAPSAKADDQTTERPGADFMIDVFKSLGFESVCANPGSAFRGIQESVINYGGNSKPEFITCCHEESSVAMGHGYFKVEGKPMLVFAHGTVGLQHASMAVYNAFCDRVPVFIVAGNNLNAATRRSNVDWVHSVQDAGSLLRDFTKFDDSPVSLGQFAESSIRAYKIAMTVPSAPVVVVADAELSEAPIVGRTDLTIPKLGVAAPPAGDPASVAELARCAHRSAESCNCGRPSCAYARLHGPLGGTCRTPVGAGCGSGKSPELPKPASAQSVGKRTDPG